MSSKELNDTFSHRLIYSSWDFQQSLSALTFLLEECEFEAKYSKIELRKFRCFETTVIVSFARPFKVGRGGNPLDLASLDLRLSEEDKALKRKILTLRDKIVAHSDEEEMEYATTSIQPLEYSELRLPLEVFQEGLYLEEKEYFQLEELLRRVIHSIAEYKFHFTQPDPDKYERKKQPNTE